MSAKGSDGGPQQQAPFGQRLPVPGPKLRVASSKGVGLGVGLNPTRARELTMQTPAWPWD